MPGPGRRLVRPGPPPSSRRACGPLRVRPSPTPASPRPRPRPLQPVYESPPGIHISGPLMRDVSGYSFPYTAHTAQAVHIRWPSRRRFTRSRPRPQQMIRVTERRQTATIGRDGISSPAHMTTIHASEPDADHTDPCHRLAPVTRIRRIQVDVWLGPCASRTHPISLVPRPPARPSRRQRRGGQAGSARAAARPGPGRHLQVGARAASSKSGQGPARPPLPPRPRPPARARACARARLFSSPTPAASRRQRRGGDGGQGGSTDSDSVHSMVGGTHLQSARRGRLSCPDVAHAYLVRVRRGPARTAEWRVAP